MNPQPEVNALTALSNQLADAVEQAGQAIVAINARRRFPSSGIHWHPGIIVTADHGIRREEEITVTLSGGRSVPATLVGRDSRTDLAVLRLEETDFPTASLANAEQLRVGQLVLAIARNFDAALSTSMGVISTLGVSWRGRTDPLIRPALMMYPGYSGSALVTIDGQVIGMNTAGPHRMSFTVPAAMVDRSVTQLLQGGRIARGYLGVGMQAVRLPETTRQSLNLPNSIGIIIVSIDPDAPADRAGILLGDVIATMNGNAVEDVSDVQEILNSQSVGQTLTLQVVRGGTLMDITVTICERPERRC